MHWSMYIIIPAFIIFIVLRKMGVKIDWKKLTSKMTSKPKDTWKFVQRHVFLPLSIIILGFIVIPFVLSLDDPSNPTLAKAWWQTGSIRVAICLLAIGVIFISVTKPSPDSKWGKQVGIGFTVVAILFILLDLIGGLDYLKATAKGEKPAPITPTAWVPISEEKAAGPVVVEVVTPESDGSTPPATSSTATVATSAPQNSPALGSYADVDLPEEIDLGEPLVITSSEKRFPALLWGKLRAQNGKQITETQAKLYIITLRQEDTTQVINRSRYDAKGKIVSTGIIGKEKAFEHGNVPISQFGLWTDNGTEARVSVTWYSPLGYEKMKAQYGLK